MTNKVDKRLRHDMAVSEQGRHFLEGKTIFVVGGGIAGLAFATGIHKQWHHSSNPPTVIVFERDSPDPDAWRAGEENSLSISGYNDAGGLVALKRLGLVDDILAHAVSELDDSGSFKIWGPDWREHLSLRRRPVAGLSTSSIRIVRKDLRLALIRAVDSCENSSIRWGSQCSGVEKLQDGRLRMHIEHSRDGDATHTDCDLLIAADGANSKLRAQFRPQDGLNYVGAVLRGGLSTFPAGLPNPIDESWGFMVSKTGVSCFFSPVDRNTVLWAVGHEEDEEIKELTWSSAPEERRAVIDRGAELGSLFHEPFPTIVQRTDPSTVMCINGRDKPPFRHDAIHDMPVVFIGDSNHALSPFAGFGANLALHDAQGLAEQLCKPFPTLAEAVEAYDRLSEPRAMRVWKGSRKNVRAGHSTGLRYWLLLAILWIEKWVANLVGLLRRWFDEK